MMMTNVMPSAMMPSNTMFIARTSRLAPVSTFPNAAWNAEQGQERHADEPDVLNAR